MTVEAVRGSLDSTDNGTVKNSIRNCLTVFQNDPKLEGAIRYNILTERIDIVNTLQKGQIITADDIDVLRPALGIPPKFKSVIIGKICKENIEKGQPLFWENF